LNAAPAAEQLLFDRVVKTYGDRIVVDGVSLTVPGGHIAALAGVNGSGKTTLLRIAAGFVEQAAGSVAIAAADGSCTPLARPPWRRAVDGLSYLSQDRRVLHGLSTLETLRLAKVAVAGRRRVPSGEIFDCLAQLRLTTLLDRAPRDMPPGEVVRLHLARAYLVNARFLLADEPFAGLDSSEVAHCVAILNALRDQGCGIVLTDHNWKPLLACANTAHIMQNGAIVYSGTAGEARSSAEARRLYFRSND
jgi:ABC-type lipopolysaccharide export system ATPase subunit